MRSVPPDSKTLDASWGSEEADLDTTQPVDAQELLARAGLVREEQGATVGTPPFSVPPPPDAESKNTLPPPIPVSDYVAKMRPRRSHSSSQITAQRRPIEAPPPEGYPPVPTRRTIPWEPPRSSGSLQGKHGRSGRQTARLGLECDEPGVPSRPSGRTGLEALAEPELDLGTELDEDLLRVPSPPFPHNFGEIDVFGSSEVDTPGAHAPASTRGRALAPDDGDRSGIDFRLDLGLGYEEPAFPTDEAPITPPPGTLRYGLIVDEDEAAFRGGTGALAGSTSYRVSAGSQGAERAPRPSDQERAPASTSGADRGVHARATEPQMSALGPREQMQHRFDQGDFGGALVLAEGLLEENPKDWMARQYADSCGERLRQMYQARLGDGSRVLRLAVPPDQLRSLNLDHRAGFLLSCIDGSSSIDEILDVSGMQTLEALRILYELVQEGVVCGV